ncbi:alcohol dehydrogenase catalytic domain-containing protein [Nocardia elegans]|uniref:zinc-dependent alcohol dehydrogenase n=1 Tax=Nocardia elegans TaxID=300029 RepID=UPI0018942F03|nr:zinc-binding dehydrogenase [Nocardia elegans]MBF6451112.1 alcohol dehydrogenase catalytic domain-containing protein [Nocardia elegans]
MSSTIKQVRVHGPGTVRLDLVELPECGPRDAVVDIHACGICGSDLGYVRLGGLAGPGPEPMPLGHEMSGVITSVGSEVTDLRPGQRVVVHPGRDDIGRIGNGSPEGGLANAVLVRDAAAGDRLFPIPDDMPFEIAALAEPLAVGMHAADQADLSPADTVAVFGCGPIGLAAIATLADRGHTSVVGVEPSATRRRIAEDLGATATIDPANEDVWKQLRHLHGSRPGMAGETPATAGFIEATGAGAVLSGIIDNAGRGARISVVAVHYTPVPVNFLRVLTGELTIRGSIEYPPRFRDAIDLLERRDLTPLITHRFPLDRIEDALATLRQDRECGKILVETDH